jgi:hypothetical protein
MAATCTDETAVDELPLTADGLWARLNAADPQVRERMLTDLTASARAATACLLEGHRHGGGYDHRHKGDSTGGHPRVGPPADVCEA